MSLEDILIRVQSPIRYLNHEINAYKKDPCQAELKIALCFPELYEVGISHLGHRLLYHILNQRSEILCDRAYAPAEDLFELLKKNSIPLFGWETKIPLKNFDLLGFTLPNELCYSNLLYILDCAGIPPRAEQRMDKDYPIILGGGPCVSNPEPIAHFFDALFFGEAEEAILEISEALKQWKKHGGGKEELLEELTKIPGIYVPAFYQPEFDEQGRLLKIEPKSPAPEKIIRRMVPDLDKAFAPTKDLVPFAEAVHDRLVVEIARGCTQGCRFCQAGTIYRPYRERTASKVLQIIREGLKATGYEECSLLSLSAGDYSQIEKLIVRIITEHWSNRIALSLPSLRVNSLTPLVLEAIKKVRKTGFTIAPEAGSERLRKMINKPISDTEIFNTTEKVLKAGWRNLKFYFMVGLPEETEEDIHSLIKLTRALSGIGRRIQPGAQFSLSINGFIPKPHTPFQWERQLGIMELKGIQEKLRKEIPRNLKIRLEDSRVSFLEGVFSRGARELNSVLESAYQKRAKFDSWSEHFRFDAYLSAFEELGINPEQYLKEKPEDTVFPWEHLDPQVSKKFLLKERDRSREGVLTEDCRIAGCLENCGVCDQRQIQPKLSEEIEKKAEPELIKTLEQLSPQPDLYFRYLVHYQRMRDLRFLGLLENNRMFVRAVRRAGLPMRFSQGFHPLPKISFASGPPVGVESDAEYLELELLEHLPTEKIKSQIQEVLPEGIKIIEVKELSLRARSINQQISLIEYLAILPENLKEKVKQEELAKFLTSEQFMIKQKRDKKERIVDLKQKIKYIELTTENNIKFGIINSQGPLAKPQEVVSEIFQIKEPEIYQVRFKRIFMRFMEQRSIAYSGDSIRKSGLIQKKMRGK